MADNWRAEATQNDRYRDAPTLPYSLTMGASNPQELISVSQGFRGVTVWHTNGHAQISLIAQGIGMMPLPDQPVSFVLGPNTPLWVDWIDGAGLRISAIVWASIEGYILNRADESLKKKEG